ncbi:MAG: DUF4124 domain-containing protein, partial [Gammaproteobacteria bacterium]|nr:DUF4124 domain-containing protein [Gammaproteobacteria bacterium]
MKVMHRFLIQNITFLLFISLFSLNANAEQLYKWVDEKGKVTYQSDPPPESAVDVEESNIRLSVES